MRLLEDRRLGARNLTVLSGVPQSGLWFWVRPEELTTSPVATWSDISGNGNDFAQPTGANQPTVVPNVLNGFPAVLFDGSNDWLGSPADSLQPLTFAGVAQRIAGSGSIMGGRNPANTSQPGALIYITNSNYTMYAGSNAESAVPETVPWLRFAAMFNGGSSRRYFNADEATVNPNTRGSGLVTIGAHISTGTTRTNFWNGYVVEVLGWARALTNAELSQVMGYFSAKYDL